MGEHAESSDAVFGAAVAQWRGFHRLSQRELADQLTERGMRVDASAISRIEKGQRSVRLAEALTIADALQIDLEMLVDRARTPRQDWAKIQRKALESVRPLRTPLRDFLAHQIGASVYLLEHPDLAHELGCETPAAYFASQLQMWKAAYPRTVASDDDVTEVDFAFYLSEEQRVGALELLRVVADSLLVDYSEHSDAAAPNADQ